MKKNKKEILPDIATSPLMVSGVLYSNLEKVGMKGIETMIRFKNYQNQYSPIPAKVDIMVNLIKPEVKGIHMSRLYKIIYDELGQKNFSIKLIEKVVRKSTSSQQGISDQGFIRIAFTLTKKNKSLLSDNFGFRHYPIILEASVDKKGVFQFTVQVQLLYSSTCPCSVALSLDYHDKHEDKLASLAKKFLATPHAQRSIADITLRFKDKMKDNFIDKIIEDLENIIKTPVQSAVKREDEQEFARLNAENLMFCEDSVRIFKNHLDKNQNIIDYKIEVSHLESLHAHDAVATTVKGIANGFNA